MEEAACLSEGEAGGTCFLGVEKSLSGKRWLINAFDDRASLTLAQRAGIPEVVGRLLAARGVGLEEVDAFLNPKLNRLLPDPDHLKGMKAACERLSSAIVQGEQIAVFGDYDVDGATSSALLSRFFSAVGGRCRIYIPDRLKEGYGPNEEALRGLLDEGVSIVVTVDCGTTSHAPLEAAARAGLDVIVVDHHESETRLPPAVAVINPNRLDEDSPHGQLAAVGVAFLLTVALNRTLRQAGWYQSRAHRHPEPDLLQWLDLVALGTVCDVVPLTGVNRALVTQGLKVMARRDNPGLKALADVAGIDEPPGTYHAGFILGPRINAGGRIGDADLGARLLATDDNDKAVSIAFRLDELNQRRREIESTVFEQASTQVEAAQSVTEPLILAVGEDWHPGVIGIVASRLTERYGRPTCVVSLAGAVGQGSARSVTGIDLGAAVIAARQAGLLIKGGGHPMAAGFTVERGLMPELGRFLGERLANAAATTAGGPILHLDGALKTAAANLDLVTALKRVEPFGAGNPEPRFAITNTRLGYADVVGKEGNHLRCALLDDGGRRLDAIAFRVMEADLGKALKNHNGALFHIAGRLRENVWRGRQSVQLIIDDAAPA